MLLADIAFLIHRPKLLINQAAVFAYDLLTVVVVNNIC